MLHRAGGRWHWTTETYPADDVSLRTVGERNFVVIDTTHQESRRPTAAHPEAPGDRRDGLEERLRHGPSQGDLPGRGPAVRGPGLRFREDEEKVAYVKRVPVDDFTDAVSAKGVWALDRFRTGSEAAGRGRRVEQGELLVAEQVVGFKKIKFDTMENVGAGEVELPQQEMQTAGLWLDGDVRGAGRAPPDRDALVDGLRGLARLLRHLAPLFLMCDVRDLGSWLGDAAPPEPGPRRRAARPDRGGRAGAPAGRRALRADRLPLRQPARRDRADASGSSSCSAPLLARARETIRACPCRAGCPSCVGPVNAVGSPGEIRGRRAPRSPGGVAAHPGMRPGVGTPPRPRPRDRASPCDAPSARECDALRGRGGRRPRRSRWSRSRRPAGSPRAAWSGSRCPTRWGVGGSAGARVPSISTRRPRSSRAARGPTSFSSGWRPGRRDADRHPVLPGRSRRRGGAAPRGGQAVAERRPARHVQRTHFRPAAPRDPPSVRAGDVVGRGHRAPRSLSGGAGPVARARRRLPATTLESALLGMERGDDLPGALVPQVYFRFLRTRDPGALPRMFAHNRWDLVALAGLHARAAALLRGPDPQHDPREWMGARALARAPGARPKRALLRGRLPGGAAGGFRGPRRLAARVALATGGPARRGAGALGGSGGAHRAPARPPPDRPRQAPRAPARDYGAALDATRAALARPRPGPSRAGATWSRRSSVGRTGSRGGWPGGAPAPRQRGPAA